MQTDYQPRCARYRERVTESFNMQQVMHTMGVVLADVRPGRVTLEFPFQASLAQQHGFIHAGVQATVMDSACGYAAFSLMPEDAGVLTVEFKINLLSPARGERFIAAARVRKPGATLTVAECELLAESEDGRKPVSFMTGTLMAVRDRQGIDN